MTHPAPLAWLVAEASAFPLASPSAFDARLVALSRSAADAEPHPSCARVAADLAEHLRLRARGASEEQLRQVRDHAWFPDGARSVPLASHVVRLARQHLAFRDGAVGLGKDHIYAPDDDGGRQDITTRALRWRWLSLALPADLLVAALTGHTGGDAPSEHVDLSTPLLSRVLERGCAETHLHVGAAVPFVDLWTAWMSHPPAPRTLGSDAPFSGGVRLEAMLASAAVTRLVLSWFLSTTGRWRGSSFQTFWRDHLDELLRHHAWHRDTARFRTFLAGALARVTGRHTLVNAAAFRLVLARVRPRSRGGAHASEPLSQWYPPAPGCGLPETRLAAQALRYLLRSPPDAEFAEIFWQYQRIRVQMYRFLVEPGGTSGLDWFSKHFQRIGPLRGALEGAKYASALRVQSQGLQLTALEARTAPSPNWIGVRDEVRAVAKQALRHARTSLPVGASPPEVGLILHFVKRGPSELKRREGARANADPAHCLLGMRFGHWFRSRWAEAQAIATTLRHHPEALVVLRAIDVASKEIATPTWVLGPLFRLVRAAGEQAARRLAMRRPKWRVPALRVTVHAGEDYRRLMEGLRRMHEAVETGLLQEGDRIGHGLALGYDIRRHAAESPLVLQPKEERLDDLLWELDRYRRGECGGEHDRTEYIRAEVERLGRSIYGQASCRVEDLVEARRLRHSSTALEELGFPRLTDRTWKGPRGLLHAYLSDPGVHARGQQKIEVRITEGEQRALQAVQTFLQKELARLEVTIETNPTSNLLIGDLGSLESHPVFRLVPLSDATPRYGVPVSVNTDNPVTFGSCLADEFALLHHALLSMGAGASEAIAWIDAAREAGVRSRFTVPASSQQQVLEEVGRPPRRSAKLAP